MREDKWLCLNYDQYTNSYGEVDPDDPYSRESTESMYDFTGLKISNYGDFPSTGFEAGQEVHCVIVVYETGDSFGNDTAEPELVYVGSKEDCDGLCEYINNDTDDGFSFEYTLSDGAVYRIRKPWVGYFESLTSCEVHKFIIE